MRIRNLILLFTLCVGLIIAPQDSNAWGRKTYKVPDLMITKPTGIWTDSRAYSSLAAAVAAVGSDVQEIVIAKEEAVTTLTILSTTSLKFTKNGSINNSGTLTLQTTDIEGGKHQIFTGAGGITFADGTELESAWFADFETAVTKIGSDKVELTVSAASSIADDCTINANTTLSIPSAGRILTVASAKTLTVNGTIEAGDYQIFDGAGTVLLDVNTTKGLRSVWWGDTGDGTTDDTAAIQSAIDCAEAIHAANVIKTNYLYLAPRVIIGEGLHIVTGLTVTAQITVSGLGNETTFLKSVTDAPVIVSSMAGTANYQPPVFIDFAITGNPTLTSQHGITSTLHCRLENMVISWVGGDGFKSTNGNTNEILYCKIQNNGGYGIHLTGTYNTNCHIVGNVIRENKIGLYIVPSSGYITTGYVLNNLFESNVSVEGNRYTNSQVGTDARPGVGIWLENVQCLTISNNYFENHLNSIYGDHNVSFCTFKSNYFGGSNGVPGSYPGNGGPVRRLMDIYIVSGQGNIFDSCHFTRPMKPAGTSDADWGTVFNGTIGTITAISNGFASLTHTASITLTSGDASAIGLAAGDWIHITNVVGTAGTDSANGLNDHSFQVLSVAGEVLCIEAVDLTGLTYISGGTVQQATTWSHEYEHIRPNARATVKDCIWQSPTGVNQQIILAYSLQHHTSNISTEVAGAATNYRNNGPQNMVWGGVRTVQNMWHGYYYKYYNSWAINATHQLYGRPGNDHIYKYIEVDAAGEPTGVETEAFQIAKQGLTFTDQVLTVADDGGIVSNKCPGTDFDSSGGAFAVTLGSGHYIGQIKSINMSTDGGDVTVTVTAHETSSPEVFTFNDVKDSLTLIWTGSDWETLKNRGVTV